jgi:hypothetical protein
MWGCCEKTRRIIHLNWQIIFAPRDVIDYVIVHELCHLKHSNHSPRFWAEVEKYLPDYRNHHKWLKDHCIDMSLPN